MSTTTLDSTALADIRRRFDGDVLEEGDAGYDDARKLFNAMIDRKPRLIVRCTGARTSSRASRSRARRNFRWRSRAAATGSTATRPATTGSCSTSRR